MRWRSDRKQRWKSAIPSSTSVNLISMMDILTVLLLFLLKSYVAGGEVMVPPPGIALPASSAEQLPQASLVVAIDQDEILVGSDRVVTVADALSGEGLAIDPLAAHLQSVRERQDEIDRLRGEAAPSSRAATIQGDRDIEFRVLRKVMYTLNRSGYESIALAVIQKS
jgi:biopolymer transport protein ExbD